MILDSYFKKPILIDYSIAIIFTTAIIVIWKKLMLEIPKYDQSISVLTDLTTISLTIAGFILTLLTVLITFKSSSKIVEPIEDSDETVFEKFFATTLYFQTVRHLKNCIKSLLFIGLIGFSLKIGLLLFMNFQIFYFNAFAMTILFLTTWRCLLILGLVLNLQSKT
jgi:hypothetical protein